MTGKGGGAEYAGIRRVLAVALTILFAAVVLWDAASKDYQVDPIVAGSILGTIASLVVVDLASIPRRR